MNWVAKRSGSISGSGLEAKPEGVNVCFFIGPVTTVEQEVSTIKCQNIPY